MSRKLIKQTCAQWRSNIWLVVELLIVATAIWFMLDSILLTEGKRRLPNGYNLENVMTGNLTYVKSGPSFEAVPEGTDTTEYHRRGVRTLVSVISNLPMVETVGYGRNAIPYNFSFYGDAIKELDRGDSLVLSGNFRWITPEMVDILQLKPLGGKSTEDLKEALRRGDILVSRSAAKNLWSDHQLDIDIFTVVGQRFFRGDSANVMRLGAIVEDIRRNDYEPAFFGTLLAPFNIEQMLPELLAIKLKPGKEGEFKEYFEKNRSQFGSCNVNIAKFSSSDDIRYFNQRDTYENVRNLLIIMSFLLISIFLGILGTFWFRTQERVGEIAIRKVNGATSADILRRLLGESMILLTLGVIVSIGLDWLVIHFELIQISGREELVPGYGVWQLMPWSVGLTYVIMTAMVMLGTYIPARRAMRIDPAVALHDE